MNEHAEQGVVGRWVNRLVMIERLAAAGLLLTILGAMGTQVVARYVFASPISWSEEWSRFALIWMAFLAAAFVMAEGSHIAVDVVSSRLPAAGKLRLAWVSNSLVVGVCLVLLAGGIRFVWRVGLVASPALDIPKSWWYGAASVGLGLMAVHGLWSMIVARRVGRPVWDDVPMADEPMAGSGGEL